MSLTKLLLFTAALIMIHLPTLAQEGASAAEASAEDAAMNKSSNHWMISVSTVNWNDTLKISQGAQQANETANYNALVLTAQREVNIHRWGYNIGLFWGPDKPMAVVSFKAFPTKSPK